VAFGFGGCRTAFFPQVFEEKTVFMVAAAVILSTSLYYGFTNTQNQSLKKLELMSGFLNERNWVESEKLGEEIIKMHQRMKPYYSMLCGI